MPIIKSAIKRVRSTERRRKRNLVTKDQYKELIKTFLAFLAENKESDAQKLFPQVQKAIDLAAKKNVIHKRNAANKKSRLAKMIKGSVGKAASAAKTESKPKKPQPPKK